MGLKIHHNSTCRAQNTFYIKIKRKKKLPWRHYKFVSDRDDHHQMLQEKISWVFLYCFLPEWDLKGKFNFQIKIIFNISLILFFNLEKNLRGNITPIIIFHLDNIYIILLKKLKKLP